MSIHALVKGDSLAAYNWIHEEGLVVISRIIDLGEGKDSLFLVHNVDRDEYAVAGGSQFITVSEDVFHMPASLKQSDVDFGVVFQDLNKSDNSEEGFTQELTEEEIKMLNEELKEDLEFEQFISSDEIEKFEDLSFEEYQEYKKYQEGLQDHEDEEIIVESLFDLYELIDKGWDEETIDKLIDDLTSLQSDEDE